MVCFWLALSAAALLANAPAPEWRFVNRDTERTGVVYADMKSMTPMPDGHVKLTVLIVSSTDRKGIAALATMFEFDCGGRQRRIVWGQGYDSTGKILFTEEKTEMWHEVPPNNFYDGALIVACSGGKKGAGPAVADPLPIAAGRAYLASTAE